MIYKLRHINTGYYMSTTGAHNWWCAKIEQVIVPKNGKVYVNHKAAMKMLIRLNKKFDNQFEIEHINVTWLQQEYKKLIKSKANA